MPKTLYGFARFMFNAGWRVGNSYGSGESPEDYDDEDFKLALAEWNKPVVETDDRPKEDTQW